MDKRLPLDVLNVILSSIPNLRSLSAAVQVSRRMHNVYTLHPRSIRAAVAHNEVGPALVQAQRFLLADTLLWDQDDPDSDFVGQLPPESTVDSVPSDWTQAHALSKRAAQIFEIERFYSRRVKDRSSFTSALSKGESHRLTRALYRLWLYISIFTRHWEDLRELSVSDGDPDLDNDDEEITPAEWENRATTLRAKQLAFLRGMVTEPSGRHELVKVARFISDSVVNWVARVIPMGMNTPLNLDFLTQVLMGHRSFSSQGYSLVTWPHTQIASDVFDTVFGKLDGDDEDGSLGRILDSPAQDSTCSKCSLLWGQQLYNELNWDLLCGDIMPHELMPLGFKGNLMRNVAEITDIFTFFQPRNLNLCAMLRGMFSLPARNDDDGGGAWAKEDWLCIACIRAFIGRHKMAWWLEIKRAAGKPIPDDCWYGYNCRTQTHSADHAGKLNHFCEQTRF